MSDSRCALIMFRPPHSNEEYITQGVAAAIAAGVQAGKTIAHPDDPIIHLLTTVDGDEAVCEHGITAAEVRFPLAECFDPNRAASIAIAAKRRSTFASTGRTPLEKL